MPTKNKTLIKISQLPIIKDLVKRSISPAYKFNKKIELLQKTAKKYGSASIIIGERTYARFDNGLEFLYYPRVAVIALYNQYEKASTDLLLKMLPKKGVFIDVGAHMGWYTLHAAKLREAQVHAFEPITGLVEMLKHNCKRNKITNQVIINKKLLSEKIGHHYIRDEVFGNKAMLLNSGNKKVQAITLDEYSKNFQRLDVIKADIEGAELLLIKGGLQTLKKFKPSLLIEIDSQQAKNFGYDPKELFRLLKKLGYTCKYVLNGPNKIGFKGSIKKNLLLGDNFFFTAKK